MSGFKAKKPRLGYTAPSSIITQNVDREWRDVYPESLQVGDLVAEKGMIIYHSLTCRNEVYIEAGVPESKEFYLDKDTKVKAFVRKVN